MAFDATLLSLEVHSFTAMHLLPGFLHFLLFSFLISTTELSRVLHKTICAIVCKYCIWNPDHTDCTLAIGV